MKAGDLAEIHAFRWLFATREGEDVITALTRGDVVIIIEPTEAQEDRRQRTQVVTQHGVGWAFIMERMVVR